MTGKVLVINVVIKISCIFLDFLYPLVYGVANFRGGMTIK